METVLVSGQEGASTEGLCLAIYLLYILYFSVSSGSSLALPPSVCSSLSPATKNVTPPVVLEVNCSATPASLLEPSIETSASCVKTQAQKHAAALGVIMARFIGGAQRDGTFARKVKGHIVEPQVNIWIGYLQHTTWRSQDFLQRIVINVTHV